MTHEKEEGGIPVVGSRRKRRYICAVVMKRNSVDLTYCSGKI